nr:MAG TPA: hypothetical protein [Caudoviricetes sp.]DAZ51394.1 MAG TPA: hypothetical protein [Caudoviricetes sp.]
MEYLFYPINHHRKYPCKLSFLGFSLKYRS